MDKESVLVVVGYSGGYGGSFFTNLLRRALNANEEELIPINDRNEFKYDTSVLGSIRYQIDGLLKAYDKADNFYTNHHVRLSRAWGVSMEETYKKLYNPDRTIFIRNLTKHIKENLKLKPGFNVINAHHYKNHGGFTIHDVHDNVVFLLLTAEDPKHRCLFELIGEIKHNPEFFSDELFNEGARFELSSVPNVIKPFDSCTLIEVGKLFLEYDESNALQIDQTLSKALNVDITLDKNLIIDYYKSNVNVLNDFLNLDVEKSTLHSIARRGSSKLESLL